MFTRPVDSDMVALYHIKVRIKDFSLKTNANFAP